MKIIKISNQGQHNLSSLELICKSLLWEGIISQKVQVSLTIVSYLQTIVLLIWGQIQVLPEEKRGDVLSDISSYMESVKIQAFLEYFFEESQYQIILSFLWVYFVLIILTLGIFYWKQKSGQYIRSFINSAMTHLSQIHVLFSFWIINVMMYYYIFLQSKRETENSDNLAYQAQSLALLVLNYLLAYLFALFAYNPFRGPDFLSCYRNTFQIWNLSIKSLLFLTLLIFNSREIVVQAWIFVVVSVFVCGIRYYKLLKSFPYYNYNAMKLHLICSSIEMEIVIVSFIGICLRNAENSSSFEILAWADVLLLPFAVIFGVSFLHRVAQQYSVRNDETLNSEDAVIKKVFSLMCILKKAKIKIDKNSNSDIFNVYFWGTQRDIHKNKALELPKVEKTTIENEFLIDKMKDHYNDMIESIINKTLQVTSQKLKDSNRLKMFLIDLSLDSNISFVLVLSYLSQVSKAHFSDRVIISKLRDKLQARLKRFLEDNQGKVLDIKTFLRLQAALDKFTKLIHSNTKKYVSFWSEYFKPKAHVVNFARRSHQIEKEADKIKQFWKMQTQKDKAFGISAQMIYTLYLSLTRAEPFEAYKISERYRLISQNQVQVQNSKQEQFSEEQLNHQQVFVIYASMAKETMGKISYVSQNVEELLDWIPDQLIGQNIAVLLPDFLSQAHHQVLQKHAKEGFQLSRIMRNVSTYIRDKRGYVSRCDIRISLYPYVQAIPMYVAAVRITSIQNSDILLSKTGDIQCFTQNMTKILELKLEHKYNLESLCQNVKEFEKIKDYYVQKDFPSDSKLSLKLSLLNPLSDQPMRNYNAQVTCETMGTLTYFALKLSKISRKGIGTRTLETTVQDSEVPDDVSENLFGSRIEIKKSFTKDRSTQIYQDSKSRSTFNQDPTPENISEQLLEDKKEPKSPLTRGKRVQFSQDSKSITTLKHIFMSDDKQATSTNVKVLREPERRKTKKDLVDIDTMVSSSLGSSSKDGNSRLERVMMKIPRNPKLSIFNILIILFAFISGGLLIYFQIANRNTLELIQYSIEIISQTIFLSQRFTDFNCYVRILWLITDNIYREGRYLEFGYDLTEWDFYSPYPTQVSIDINQRANNVSNFIEKLDPELQTKFYADRIPVWDPTSNNTLIPQPEYYNFFDMVTELSSHGIRIVPSGGPYDRSNPDMVFCVNNTYGDVLLAGEAKIPILQQDNELKMNNQIATIYGIIGGLIGASLCALYFFFRIEKEFIRTRNQFIAIFSSFDNNMIQDQVDQVKDFLQYLQIKDSKSKDGGTKTSLHKLDRDKLFISRVKPQKAKGSQHSKKLFDYRGLDTPLIIIFLSTFIVFLIILSFSLILLIVISNQKDTVITKMNLLTTADLYTFHYIDLFNEVYVFGQDGPNGQTRNIPVIDEFEIVYTYLQPAPAFYATELLDPKYGLTSDPLIAEILTGSLCDTIGSTDPIIEANCKTIGGGVLEKGLIGLNTYLISALDMVRKCFESILDDWTVDNRVACFSIYDFMFMELYYPFALTAYHYIDDLIREKIAEDVENSRNTAVLLIFLYFGMCIFVSGIIWFRTQKRLQNEMIGWRRMIKQIPHSILTENRVLRAYIMKNSDLD